MNDFQIPTDPAAVAERSAAFYTAGYYCAESVLQAAAQAHGFHNPWLTRIATGFCGGVSRTAGMCGALSGGIMALGLITGRGLPGDDKVPCYTLTYHLVRQFREHFGSTACADLLSCDISTPEGERHFIENNLEVLICERITREAARLVAEMLNRRAELRHPLVGGTLR